MNLRRVPAFVAVWWAGQHLGGMVDARGTRSSDFFLAVWFFQMAVSLVLVSALQCLDGLYFAGRLPACVAGLRTSCDRRPPAPHTLGRMAAVLVRNQLVSGVAILYLLSGAPPDRWHVREGALYRAGAGLAYAGLFEAIFYAGHRLLHWGPLYGALHALHHQTHADSAVSFGYMDLIDYTLETTLPGIAPLYIVGAHPPSYFGFLAVGLFNAILVHSGWDFLVLADPARHRTHHLRPSKNLGNGPLDWLLGTSA